MVGRQKYGRDLNVEQIVQIRAVIEEKTAHIPQSTQFQVGVLRKHIEKLSKWSCTPHQIRHLRNLNFIRPRVDSSGDRKVYWYDRATLQDLLVILTLENDHHIPLSKIGGLLWAEERQRNALLTRSGQQSPVALAHNQMKRAQFYVRGRVLEIVLTWLFDGPLPCQAIIMLRRQLYPNRTEKKVTGKIITNDAEWSQVERTLKHRTGDVVLTVSQEGEVLHVQEAVEWQEFRPYRWYYLVFQGELPAADYHLIIGTLPDPGRSLLSKIVTPGTAQILTPLLQLCFAPQWQEGAHQAETPLQAMTNMIPDIAPSWQYCAILASDRASGENLLRVLAHSTPFPSGVNTGTTLLSPGQLLSGWTFQTGQVSVVQRSIGPDDPRIARQNDEQAVAGIAVPTGVNVINGVIYVGTRVLSPERAPFPPAQIQVLRMLGSIVGEYIERQSLTQKTRRTGLHILTETPLERSTWGELSVHLAQALHQVKTAPDPYDHLDNLHIMAVQLDNYREIQIHSDEVARWVVELVASTAGDFYRSRYLASPLLFVRKPSEFVMVINHLRLDDARERQLRRELRNHLGTLILPFDQGTHSIQANWLVWSLSFRYEALCDKLEQSDEQSLALALQQEVEDVLANLSDIERAHQHEAEGAYHLACDYYYLAHKRAPHNTYLMRHLAKMRTRLGDYHGAVGWWERVLNHEQHSRFYQHLAEVYALLQDYPAAIERYRLAAELDPNDARCYLGWGQVLLAIAEYEAALEKFIKARLLDTNQRALYALREAETYAGMGNYRQALDACERALIWERDNPDATKLLLQILPKCQ